MESGAISITTLSGGFDLRHTLESGQSYRWRRRDDGMYTESAPSGVWYETVTGDAYLRVRQRDGRLEWESTTDVEALLQKMFRLNDDLEAIYASLPNDSVIQRSIAQYRGMRIVQDPPFPCLISFICSAQMRVERIHQMQSALADAYGDPIEVDGERHHAFPTPEQLAGATDAELRDLGLGYRAPYVAKTARMVADGLDPRGALDRSYEAAREFLTQYVGVGDKVADCVLLFSLGYLEAVPLDTWIRRAIEHLYPDCDRGGYAETSRAIRARLGGQYAGYAQTYVFHFLRMQNDWQPASGG